MRACIPRLFVRPLATALADNVLVVCAPGEGATLKIADFGLARAATASGRVHAGYGGALYYMAPEICTGAFDAKVCGCVLV